MMIASIGSSFHLLNILTNTVLHTFGHVEFEILNDVTLYSSLRAVPRYSVELTLRGVKLPSRDWMSKSDPYFEILRRRTTTEDRSGVMYRSETYDNEPNPRWKPARFDLDHVRMSLLIRVWDDDGNNRADMIGEVEIPDPRRVRTGTAFVLYDSRKKRKKGARKAQGSIVFDSWRLCRRDEDANKEDRKTEETLVVFSAASNTRRQHGIRVWDLTRFVPRQMLECEQESRHEIRHHWSVWNEGLDKSFTENAKASRTNLDFKFSMRSRGVDSAHMEITHGSRRIHRSRVCDSENGGTSLSWPRGTVCIENKELEKDPSLTICVFGHRRHVTGSNDAHKRGMYEIGHVYVENVYRVGSGRMLSLRGKREDGDHEEEEESGVLIVMDFDIQDNNASSHEHLHPYVAFRSQDSMTHSKYTHTQLCRRISSNVSSHMFCWSHCKTTNHETRKV